MPTLERFLRPAAKLLGEGPRGWILLARTQMALWRAKRIIRRRPQGELYQELGRRPGAPAPADPAHGPRVHRIGLAVDRVARLGLGRPLCLVRSLAYQSLLEAEGIPGSRIAVGVRKRSGRFEAHAWVEWNGAVVGEEPAYVATFTPLTNGEGTREPPLPHGFR